MDESNAKKIQEKIEKHKKNQMSKEMEEGNIDEEIKRLEKTDKKISTYQRFVDAFEKDLDIDPGRLMGLTDGIFSIVMTLLIFGMALPEEKIVNYTGFIDFIGSISSVAGVVIVSFILLASFWLYHHEFMKIKKIEYSLYMVEYVLFSQHMLHTIYNIHNRKLFTLLLGKCDLRIEYTFSCSVLLINVLLCP